MQKIHIDKVFSTNEIRELSVIERIEINLITQYNALTQHDIDRRFFEYLYYGLKDKSVAQQLGEVQKNIKHCQRVVDFLTGLKQKIEAGEELGDGAGEEQDKQPA